MVMYVCTQIKNCLCSFGGTALVFYAWIIETCTSYKRSFNELEMINNNFDVYIDISALFIKSWNYI